MSRSSLERRLQLSISGVYGAYHHSLNLRNGSWGWCLYADRSSFSLLFFFLPDRGYSDLLAGCCQACTQAIQNLVIKYLALLCLFCPFYPRSPVWIHVCLADTADPARAGANLESLSVVNMWFWVICWMQELEEEWSVLVQGCQPSPASSLHLLLSLLILSCIVGKTNSHLQFNST